VISKVGGRVPVEQRRVIILYDHPLLGEGLERLLRDRTDLDVQLVHVDSRDAARAAVLSRPDVVILERCAPVQALDLLPLAPDAVFIDVGLDAGPSWTYRREELSPWPDAILQAIATRPRPVPGSAGR
jgi:DNA-binding NarL/FixJ family response regulator